MTATFLLPLLYITVIIIAEGFILFSHPTTCEQGGNFIIYLGEYIPFLEMHAYNIIILNHITKVTNT